MAGGNGVWLAQRKEAGFYGVSGVEKGSRRSPTTVSRGMGGEATAMCARGRQYNGKLFVYIRGVEVGVRAVAKPGSSLGWLAQ
jgi:hypothetical protein